MASMRKELALLIALVIIVILLASAVTIFEVRVEQSDATRFVLSDLQDKYPSADNEIISVEEKTNEQGGKYFYIKARVTDRAASPCPERMHVYYNYPEQNFETEPTEYVVVNCQVCAQEPCILVFPEEAIIASHTLEDGEPVSQFIYTFPSAYPVVEETFSGWYVTWDSPISTYYYAVVVSREGELQSVAKIEKEL